MNVEFSAQPARTLYYGLRMSRHAVSSDRRSVIVSSSFESSGAMTRCFDVIIARSSRRGAPDSAVTHTHV